MSKRQSKKRADFATAAEHKAWLKRSRAAKKGWITRYERQLPKKISDANRRAVNAAKALGQKKPPKIIKAKVGPKPKSTRKRKTEVDRLKRELAASKAREKAAEARIAKMLDDELPDFSTWDRETLFDETMQVVKEHTRKDGSIGIFGSRLRAHPSADELYKELRRARKKGLGSLTGLARIIAEMYNVTLREVYTLLESP